MSIAIVTRSHASTGRIFVRMWSQQSGLHELHDILLDTPADNEVLAYDSASTLWKNQTAAEANLATLTGGNSFTGAQTIAPTGVSIVPLTINSVASQTANGIELFDDALVKRFSVSRYGTTVVGGSNNYGARLNVQPGTAATIGQVIRGETSQTANLQEWQNSAGTVLARVSNTGSIVTEGIQTGSASFIGIAYNGISNPATFTTLPTLIVKAIASQTANLQEWQSSAASVIARVNSDGSARFSNSLQLTSGSVVLQDTGVIAATRRTSAPGAPGANTARFYFRDGTASGTMRMCVQTGASGIETTILDNIDTTGTDTSTLGVKFIDGGTA